MKPSDKETNKIRLQVFLSHNGVCSRRRALEIIKEGKVSVNGNDVLEPSTLVNPEKDSIRVDGNIVKQKRFSYILLNKPKGFVTTKKDPFAKKTIYDLLPGKFQHLSPVGRLDRDTEGLLLLTNDGDLTYQLTHPRFKVDKTYFAKIRGQLEPKNKMKLEKGVFIQGKRTAPAKIKNVRVSRDSSEFTMIIHEGRKRQIRLMLAKVGHKVIYLKRISQGPLHLGSLKLGRFREVSKKIIDFLKTDLK